ncbi:hypothetical protein Tco_0253502, partial [Tanacetum coccineum]
RERYPQRQVARDTPDLSLGNIANVVVVASKLSYGGLDHSFRRKLRGGVEQAQFELLKEKVDGIILNISQDRWNWSLVGSGEFSMSSVRKLIDDALLPTTNTKTRWINVVPIKINVHACLPTRFNLSRRVTLCVRLRVGGIWITRRSTRLNTGAYGYRPSDFLRSLNKILKVFVILCGGLFGIGAT